MHDHVDVGKYDMSPTFIVVCGYEDKDETNSNYTRYVIHVFSM